MFTVPIENIGLVIPDHSVNQEAKMVSSGMQCMFVRHNIAMSIVNEFEFSPLNKMEWSLDGSMIKEVGIKLQCDRLSTVSPYGNPSLFDEPGESFTALPVPTEPDKPVHS